LRLSSDEEVRMNFKAIFGAALVATLVTLSATGQTQPNGPVPGWILAGSKPANYEIGVTRDGGQARNPAAFLKAKKADTDGFGTLMQQVDAQAYQGKRVRFSAAVRTEDVGGWAGLWMRVDTAMKGGVSFDNMQDRPIKGTTGWQRYDVVLEVPSDASTVNFGVLGSGGGTAWLDEVRLEIVPDSVPLTSRAPAVRPKQPQNLDFRG
jgi:hypothetical protein